jgi:hypothetical protein
MKTRIRQIVLGAMVASMFGGCVVRVREPLQPAEVVAVAPSPNHLGIRGYWARSGRAWVWVPGRWEVRRPGHDWVEGHWARRAHGWVWVPGHWRRL